MNSIFVKGFFSSWLTPFLAMGVVINFILLGGYRGLEQDVVNYIKMHLTTLNAGLVGPNPSPKKPEQTHKEKHNTNPTNQQYP
jgi:hypothetical protein